jgi:hypothetical protein
MVLNHEEHWQNPIACAILGATKPWLFRALSFLKFAFSTQSFLGSFAHLFSRLHNARPPIPTPPTQSELI